MKFARMVICLIAGAICGNTASAAPILYGITGAANAESSLYTVDPVTGTTSLIGSTGYSHLTGLDFDPTTGILYAVQSDIFGSGATNLLTLDTSTGAGTIVGPTGQQIPDITIGSDGIIRGWTECGDPICSAEDDLVVIDKLTGAVTVTSSDLGTARTGVASQSATSIFVKYNRSLYSVDVGTGVATILSDLGVSMQNILENTPTGDLISGNRSDTTTQLYGIDSTTFAVSTLGVADVEFSALAYSVESVPEPATLLLLGLGLAALGYTKQQRTA